MEFAELGMIDFFGLILDLILVLLISYELYKILKAFKKMNDSQKKIALMNVFNRGLYIFRIYGFGAFLFAFFQLIAIFFSYNYYLYSFFSVYGAAFGSIPFLIGTKKLYKVIEYGT